MVNDLAPECLRADIQHLSHPMYACLSITCLPLAQSIHLLRQHASHQGGVKVGYTANWLPPAKSILSRDELLQIMLQSSEALVHCRLSAVSRATFDSYPESCPA